MFLAEILKNHFHSVAIIGMAKNTGKTYTFNHLAREAYQRGLRCALTSIGLDGEERDSILLNRKPPVRVSPGMVVATAQTLLASSGLDYEVLATTGVATPLGEVVAARVLSRGRILLAGPGSAQELAEVKRQLAPLGCDLLLVDGAVDRRSLSAPLVTDTAVLAVGAEAAWDRGQLLTRLKHLLSVLTLPGIEESGEAELLGNVPEDFKLVGLGADGEEYRITRDEFFSGAGASLAKLPPLRMLYVRGMLTDAVLAKVLNSAARPASFTLAAADPTAVFLSQESLAGLAARSVQLRVLRPLHLSAVTVSPFHSKYGYAEPVRLLEDVGRAVHPLPCYDLRLGLRYRTEKEEIDAVP